MANPEDKKQMKFVDWLIRNNLYNVYDNAHTMRRMMSVWVAAGLDQDPESQHG